MVTDWRFDDGEPHYMAVIDQWTERRDPKWRCAFRAEYPGHDDEVAAWMLANMSGDYELLMRFNGGDPFLSISITDADDASLFRLRWS